MWTCEHKNKKFTIEKNRIQQTNTIKMETCPTDNLQHKRNNKHNHELTNTRVAAKNYYCQQCKRIINLADLRKHLQSNEHKIKEKMFYCEVI